MKRTIVLLLAAAAGCGTPSAPGTGPAASAPAAAVPSPAILPPPPGHEAPAAAPPNTSKFWTDAELALLDRGLHALNATRADLGFQKKPLDDPFRLSVVNRALDDPLSVGDEAQSWDDEARKGDPAALADKALRTLIPEETGWKWEPSPVGLPAVEEHLPEAARAPFRALCDLMDRAGETSAHGLQPLGDLRDAVLRKALGTQVEHPKDPPKAADMEDGKFLEVVRRIDQASLLDPGRSLAAAVRDLARALEGPGDWKGTVRAHAAFGDVVVSGYGDDLHDEGPEVALVIDLGGNDTWTRGASASVLRDRPVSVCIDVSGDDRYISRDDFCFGAALGGVAIQWDCGDGDDVYEAGHCSLGAGICGVGVLVDEGGDDVYRCRDFGIGAGAFGIGILLDKGGNDSYHGDLFNEGFASTRGCGVLVDMAGNDGYDSGGVHVHAPLYNDRYESLSQGFSIGMRPDASGGVGVLVDLKGNDRYTADIFGQGASYWYALGILVDDDGNDVYDLGQYGQGSGIHLSAGILVDRAGSDLYYLKNGVGMGGAHDYSTGVLVDRGGDDYYAGSGGSQGGALTNSVALLFDDGGKDAYAVATEGSQGYASPARGTGGIGLLLDAGGKDTYSEWTRDGQAWTKEILGAGLDEPGEESGGSGDPGTPTMTPEKAKEFVDREGTVPGPDGKPKDDLDRLWKISGEWEVGDYRVIAPIARERLVALGKPALDRALDRVGDKHGLEFRACEYVFSKFPKEEVVPRLLERTRDPDAYVRRGAVRSLATLQAVDAVPRFVEMLASDGEARSTVLAALAGMKQVPPEVLPFLRSKKESEGVAAALCLAAAGDAAAIRELCGCLGPDVAYPVRTAAWDRLAALGDAAVPALRGVAWDAALPVMARRNALRALGRSKSKAAVPLLEAALACEDPAIRLSAFQAADDLAKALQEEDGKTPAPAPAEGKALAAAVDAARAAETDPLVKRMR